MRRRRSQSIKPFAEGLCVSTRRTVNSAGNFLTTCRGPESLVIEGARANRLLGAQRTWRRLDARRRGAARRGRGKGPTSCCSSNRSESSRLLYQTHKSRLYCCYMLSRTNPRHGHGNSAPCKNNVSPYRWMRLLHTKTRCVSYFLDLSIFPASVRAGIPRAAQARSGETIGRLEILGSRTIGSLAVPPPPTPPCGVL